ncbi:MAG: hypothetical protein ACK2TU_03135 [Anaerolineales bacterium]|jgi:hypothetical protein
MQCYKICKIILLLIISFSTQSWSAILNDSTKVIDSTAAVVEEPITVPEGTRLMVKLDKPINTAENPTGSVFTAVLETDLAVDGKVVAPKGSQVYGKVIESRGGRVLGGQKLIFQFTDLMINNQLTPILTDPMGVEGGRGNTAKMVGAGALIGSAFGGGEGAGTGALIAGGLAVLRSRGNHIQIPADTIADVTIKAPLVIK